MRAGRLSSRLDVYALSGNPAMVELQSAIWVDVRETRGSGQQTGLRAAVACEMIARPEPPVTPGQMLTRMNQMWVVDGVINERYRARIIATELAGEAAQYIPANGAVRTVQAFLVLNAPYIEGGAVSYEHRIDVAKLQLPGGPKRGDTITMRGITWGVIGLVPGGDDGAVLQIAVSK